MRLYRPTIEQGPSLETTKHYNSTGTTSHGAPKGSSLKAQLRGKQRLLNKVLSATPLDQQTAEEFLKRKQALETSMISLKV